MEEIDVCLDCDGVLADFQSAVLNIVNELLDSNYQINDITDYYIQKLLPSNNLKNRFYEILNSSDLILNLSPFEEAIEGVNKIKEIANIHIVTAPLLIYPNWIKHRNSWLQKYFKIDPKSVIHTHAKYMIFSDFFVDDKPENIKEWKNKNNYCTAVLWKHKYNENEILEDVHHFNDWNKLIELVKEKTLKDIPF